MTSLRRSNRMNKRANLSARTKAMRIKKYESNVKIIYSRDRLETLSAQRRFQKMTDADLKLKYDTYS